MNISNLITYHAGTCPGAVAVITGNRTYSFAALDRVVSHAAARLSKLDIAPGDVVGTAFLGNGLPHLVAILALARVGAVSVPIRNGIGPDASREIAARFGVKAIVAPTAKAAVAGTQLITVDRSWMEAPADARFDAVSGRGEEPWRLMLTSGTTGAPKCIAYTHAQTMQQILFYGTMPLLREPDARLMCAVSFDIAFGLNNCLRYLLNGRTVVIAMRRDGESRLDYLNRYRITHAYLSPHLLQEYIREAPRDAERCVDALNIVLGGGATPDALLQEVRRKLTRKLHNSYGSSETGRLAYADVETLERFPATVGRVVPWVEVEIVDDSDRVLPSGESGLLRCRGIGPPRTYYDNSEASAERFRGGWYYPGDVASMSADGLLFLQGRADDVINFGGQNVPPETIERVLTGHPEVAEAAAFAASLAGGGKAVHAAVVARGNFDEWALLEFCRQQMGASVLERIHSVAALPRNPNGKVLRRELAQRFSEPPAAADTSTGTAEEN
jgi:acyl-coenzyme A synthetase/AMP-(fatty) acid ligase